MADNSMQDIELMKAKGTPEAVLEFVVKTRRKIDACDERLGGIGEYLETAEGKTFFERAIQDRKDMQVELDEQKKNYAEIAKQILKMQAPAAASVSDEQNKENQIEVFNRILVAQGKCRGKDGWERELKEADLECKFDHRTVKDPEMKAISTLNISRAGVLIAPYSLGRQIIDTNLRETTSIRPFVTEYMLPGPGITLPIMRTHGRANWHKEDLTRTKDESAEWGDISLGLHGSNAYYDITVESLMWSAFPLLQLLRTEYTDSLSALHNTGFHNGSGVGEPEGFTTKSTVATINQGEATAITNVDAVKSLWWRLKAKYKPNARYIMNSLTGETLSLIKDGDGHYMLRSIQENQDFKICGKPVIFSEDMPDIGANTYPIFCADWKRFYAISDAVGGQFFIADNLSQKASGKIEYMFTKWVDGKVVTAEAAKRLYVHV